MTIVPSSQHKRGRINLCQIVIIDLLRKRGPLSTKEIFRALAHVYSAVNIQRNLIHLRKVGKLESERNGQQVHWRVVEAHADVLDQLRETG